MLQNLKMNCLNMLKVGKYLNNKKKLRVNILYK